MNLALLAAAVGTVLVGSIHSVVGERRIFRRASGGVAGAQDSGTLELGRYRGILRASWHITTFLGFGMAAVMLHLALVPAEAPLALALRLGLLVPIAASAAAVFWWTRGRHPGWIGLAMVAVLCGLA
jgi:hypothetical protein